MVRIKCIPNEQHNKQYSDHKPYTTTVLPVFIQSYSRFECRDIVSAINKYISGNLSNAMQAAVAMYAENEKTFIKYYSRMVKRCNKWRVIVAGWIAALYSTSSWKKQPAVNYQTVQLTWNSFLEMIDTYCDELEKLPGGKTHSGTDLRVQYLMAILSQNRMGLGP